MGQSSRNKILSNFIWNLDFWQTLKFVQGDLEGILTWGFFLKSSRLLKDFMKMKYAMPCYTTLGQNLIRKDFTLYDLFKRQPNALLI
jgi:hypothetical protein